MFGFGPEIELPSGAGWSSRRGSSRDHEISRRPSPLSPHPARPCVAATPRCIRRCATRRYFRQSHPTVAPVKREHGYPLARSRGNPSPTCVRNARSLRASDTCPLALMPDGFVPLSYPPCPYLSPGSYGGFHAWFMRPENEILSIVTLKRYLIWITTVRSFLYLKRITLPILIIYYINLLYQLYIQLIIIFLSHIYINNCY